MAGAVRISIPGRSRAFCLLQNSQNSPGVNHVCYSMIPESKAANIHLHLAQSLTISGATPLLPIHAFMACTETTLASSFTPNWCKGASKLVSVQVTPSHCLSLCLTLSLSLSHPLTVSPSHCLCLTLSLSHPLTVSLSPSHCLCLTLSLSLSHPLTVSLSHPLTVSLSHPLTVSVSVSPSHFLPVSLPVCLTFSLSHCLSHSPSLCRSHRSHHKLHSTVTDWSL